MKVSFHFEGEAQRRPAIRTSAALPRLGDRVMFDEFSNSYGTPTVFEVTAVVHRIAQMGMEYDPVVRLIAI